MMPGDSSLVVCEYDQDLVSAITMTVLDKPIEFQFAPKITSEANTSDWLEADLWAQEPLKVHKGSGGRKIAMEWEYIATDNVFTGKKIANILRTLKTYFFEFNRQPPKYPLVIVSFTEVLPEKVPCRMTSLNITYSDEKIKQGGKYYPLYIKVSIQLELVTTANISGEKAKVDMPGLKPMNPQWY
jgi:hypothetical protein